LYQVCYDLEDEKTRKREISAFKNFTNPIKYLITYKDNEQLEEVKVSSVENFLL